MYDTILCATDFSERATEAFNHALELANDSDATLHVVHAIEPRPLSSYGPSAATFPAVHDFAEHVRGELDRLVHARQRTSGQPVAHVERGRAHDVISTVASEIGADVIVVGTHGRSGLPRLLMGSTAEKVLRTANVPVLAIPPAPEA